MIFIQENCANNLYPSKNTIANKSGNHPSAVPETAPSSDGYQNGCQNTKQFRFYTLYFRQPNRQSRDG